MEIGTPSSEIGQSVASVRGSQVVSISSAENEVSARIGKLEEIALLASKIDAKFQRMPAPDPGQCIRDLENVFEYMLGKPLRVSQRGEAGYIDVG